MSMMADGYYNIGNFSGNSQIASIAAFVAQMTQISSGNVKLAAAAFTNSSKYVVYRLSYQLLPFGNLTQEAYVQMTSDMSYQLLSSNFSSPPQPNFTRTNLKAATSDAFVSNVNKLLLSNYGNILGPNAAVVDVLTSPPYYQLVYQTLQYNYTFTVLYDYLQGRIIQATASSAKITAM